MGWDEDQCWTLARIAEVVRRRFTVDYTLAGLDLLLHRAGHTARPTLRGRARTLPPIWRRPMQRRFEHCGRRFG